MISNYIRVAWRNLLKNRNITFINIAGLSIGVAACLLISVYILHETSYDRHVPNANQIYRLVGVFDFDGSVKRGTHFSANMARTLDADYEEVQTSGRMMDNPLFYGAGENDIRIDGKVMQHSESGFVYTDQGIIDIFDLSLVEGDAGSALSSPKSIVISERKARKYFNEENPIGKTIFLNGNDDDPFTITGVMEDFPSTFHMDYDFLITLSEVEFGEGEQERWLQNNYFTYLEIAESTNIPLLEEKITRGILGNYLIPALEEANNALAENFEEKVQLELQPISDIHLYSSEIFDSKTRGDIRIVWMFGLVALFILIIAAINFINLSTAKSSSRAKEVGLRKVLGSGRNKLISQFLTESCIVSLLSFGVGLILAAMLLPVFNQIAEVPLTIPYQSAPFMLTFLGAGIGVGLLAGVYPSFYLSGFSPIRVLQGTIRRGAKSSGLRSGLVVFQFTISIVLICGTLIINRQMNYILNTQVGYEKDQVIQIHSTNILTDQLPTFKEEVKKLSGVVNASISDYLPIAGTKRNTNPFYNEGMQNIEEAVSGQAWIIDEDYIETLGMTLVDGRNFSRDRDENLTVIINQKMANSLNLDEPVGQKIERGGRTWDIIGVVEDFNYESFRQQVNPIGLFYGTAPTIMSVKTSSDDLPKIISDLEGLWNDFDANLDFRYTFMDQSFADMYKEVRKTSMIFTAFAALAIIVACLGLFALSAFIVEQRSKEMSIRKVLGASLQNIFQLLTRQFVILIGISLLIATPVAYTLMQKWLQDFEYRIDISLIVFVIAGILSLFITIVTISYHALRTATNNPSENLRNE